MDDGREQRRTCSNCGAELDASANFCPSCGAAQRPDPEIPQDPPPPIPEPGRIETPEVPGVPPPPPGATSPLNSLGPLKVVGIGCGAVLLVFVLLVGCLSLIGSGSQDETASVEATAEETTEEEAAEEEATEEDTRPIATGSRVKENTREETTTAPPPRTPEERLRRAIEDVFTLTPEDGPQDLEDLQIQNRNGQCYDVYVRFKGNSLTASWTVWNIETRMEQVYEAAYIERDSGPHMQC